MWTSPKPVSIMEECPAYGGKQEIGIIIQIISVTMAMWLLLLAKISWFNQACQMFTFSPMFAVSTYIQLVLCWLRICQEGSYILCYFSTKMI